MMGTAVGMAMEGKIPIVYSITPFAIYRPFELIRNYLSHEQIPVKIVGGGRDKQYGYLSTDKTYKDFELTLEFKQEANGNSGVFFRSSISGVKISGWQVEVAPLNNHTGGIYESYGRGWLIQPKKEDEQWLKTGEWNKMKIVVRGDDVTTFLNGHQMIYINDAKIGQGNGFIALQIHDGGGIRVRWKNIRIREL
jgi:transketolase C-terminal domain/subunit